VTSIFITKYEEILTDSLTSRFQGDRRAWSSWDTERKQNFLKTCLQSTPHFFLQRNRVTQGIISWPIFCNSDMHKFVGTHEIRACARGRKNRLIYVWAKNADSHRQRAWIKFKCVTCDARNVNIYSNQITSLCARSLRLIWINCYQVAFYYSLSDYFQLALTQRVPLASD
jgi:hypothetical protein